MVRTQVARAIRAARESDRIRADHEPSVGIALILASQLDIAAKAKSTGDVVRLAKELRAALADLPLREGADGDPGTGSGDSGPGSGSAAGAVGTHTGGLAQIIRAPAQMGDTAVS